MLAASVANEEKYKSGYKMQHLNNYCPDDGHLLIFTVHIHGPKGTMFLFGQTE